MRLHRILLASLAALLLAAMPNAHAQIAVVGDGGPGPVKAPHLTAELVSLGPSIAPGGQQEVGLILTLDDDWHVYWTNPGDSGLPPHITWSLPAGISAGPMQFPPPSRLSLDPLMDFGYEDQVAFPITLSAAPNTRPGPIHLDAQISWLVCSEVCVPGKAYLGLDLTVAPGAPPISQEPHVGALGKAISLLPRTLPADIKFSIRADPKQFQLTLLDGKREETAEFYPYDPGLIANAHEQDNEPQRDGTKLYLDRAPNLKTLPPVLHGVLKLSDQLAYDVSAPVVPVESVWPPEDPPAPKTAILRAIALAFLGGLILNLMPCVFPVLFLKGLGLAQTAGTGSPDDRASMRRHGLAYALGILVSFWAIVAALLVVRTTGGHAGWGFQLQSPGFVAILASFLFFFALSLAGQFEIGLSLTSTGSSLLDTPAAHRQSYPASFLTGILATVVATPCTAPLMGAAVGFALAQTPIVAFAVFTSLALGLAAPYVLLSWKPGWARILPKPGRWMEIFKHATAAVFFATTIWLSWVYGQLYPPATGINHVALLLTCFLLLAIAGWALGRWPARRPSTLAATLLIAFALALPLSQLREPRPLTTQAPTTTALSDVSANQSTAEIVWQPYSQQALDRARASGHPVFIDFTAAWCLSCQFNERVVLKSPEVESALRQAKVVTLKADWTNSDPAITQKLAELGRAAVPTYVLYPAPADSDPDVLPELLTKNLVLKAIESDTK